MNHNCAAFILIQPGEACTGLLELKRQSADVEDIRNVNQQHMQAS